MNLIRPLHLLVVVAAIAASTSVANAGSRCSDDPERCVERGASVSRPAARSVVIAPGVIATQSVVSMPARKATLSRKAPKVARVTPAVSPAPAPTPGMGMLLKLSNGTGGDVTWQAGRSTTDNTGASWIL